MNMGRCASLCGMSTLGLILAAGLWHQPASARQAPEPSSQPADRGVPNMGHEPSVSRSMKSMGRALRALKAQISDPAKRDENLKLLGDIERACVSAKNQPVPDDLLAADAPAERRRKHEFFRRHLIEALRVALDIESELLDGKPDDARDKITSLVALRNRAHEELGVEDD